MTRRATRRDALAFGLVGSSALLAAPLAARTPLPTVLIEQTYLKALPGMRADLASFIQRNWFVMDGQGVERGLFTGYWLMEDIDDNAEWDLVMAVGYPQAQGYEDPPTKAAFDAIRKAHIIVPVNGRTLAALGSIVKHHRLGMVAGQMP